MIFQAAILQHARAICGVCACAPDVVPSLITLCHTVFICPSLSSTIANPATLTNTQGVRSWQIKQKEML